MNVLIVLLLIIYSSVCISYVTVCVCVHALCLLVIIIAMVIQSVIVKLPAYWLSCFCFVFFSVSF